VDQNGVNFEFDAPRCDLGDRALELVRTGVYSGCSFEFKPKDYEKRVEGDTVTIINRSFEYLNALTLGMDPAYRQTSVNVRELKGGVIEGTEETEEQKREREEREAQALREQEEREREQRAIAAHSRRKREIEMFDIENNY
jgi:phage head maturation protease